MSLINDALKRANEQKAKHLTAGELGCTMKVVESPSEETKLWPIALFALLLVGALWFGWSGLHPRLGSEDGAFAPVAVNARGPESHTDTTESPSLPEVTKMQDPSAPRLAQTGDPSPISALPPAPAPLHPAGVGTSAALPAAPARRNAFAESGSPAPAATPAVPAANSFPKLILQGVYYRPSRPSAVINSTTVYVGDRVQQVKVLAIDRHEVTVQWNNEVRVLALH